MKSERKHHNFIIQGSILAAAGILCRIIGMFYRIPLIEIIGTKGNGYYTSSYNIYNVCLVISSYSLPIAISRMLSARLSSGRTQDARRVLQTAFIYATAAGGIFACAMFFGADFIAARLGKPFCSFSIRTLAPTIWIMAYLGVFRGCFQGTGNMVPTAVSQIAEQIVNAAVSLLMASKLFAYGENANLIYGETEYSFAFGAAGGTIGTGAGALSALILFIVLYIVKRKEIFAPVKVQKNVPVTAPDNVYDNAQEPAGRETEALKRRGRRAYTSGARRLTVYAPSEETPQSEGRASREGRTPARIAGNPAPESWREIAVVMLMTLTPILLNSTISNISPVLDDYLFSNIMTDIGLGSSVVLLWGVYGEYRILFNIPVAVSNSMSSSVIPSITRAVSERNRRLVLSKIRAGIRFTMLVAMPSAVGLAVLSRPICDLLFRGQDNTVLIRVLCIGSAAVVFFSAATITNGILQGLGHFNEPLVNSFKALLLHAAVLYVLLKFLKLGIYAVIMAGIVYSAAVSWMNLRCIRRHVRFRMDAAKTVLIPFSASAVMGAVSFFAYRLTGRLLPEGSLQRTSGLCAALLVSILCAVFVYGAALLLLKAFDREELLSFPGGRTLSRLLTRFGVLK